ncbi:hypothetical protein O181_074777 [Austropuccinia psidii MF-1]|uniref:Uncharacterized protein n=1 Tax=Austropuccinia psidii MF-1 TaxID=1389203 RepID=A0A9Q3IC99_9BASI|nr:hypothetical protein [Austropuccinia psidii MF-1]
MHPVLKVAGVVYIWYYIPLCTIFSQQFNGDIFRTQFHLSKSRSQTPMPILKEDFLTHQSGNQKTIQGSQPPGPAGVGLAISFRIMQRGILRGYTSFQSVFRASSISILLGKLNLFIQAPINQPKLNHYYFLYPLEPAKAPLDGTPAVPPLKAQLDRGPIKEGAAPSRKEGRVPRRSNFFSGVVGGFPGMSRTTFRGPGEEGEEEEENSVEKEESDGTEASPAPVGASEGTRGPTLSQSDQPVSHQTEPSLLAIMQ